MLNDVKLYGLAKAEGITMQPPEQCSLSDFLRTATKYKSEQHVDQNVSFKPTIFSDINICY